jgi:acyl carrier protein
MTTQEFIMKLKEALEFEKVNMTVDTNLKNIEGYDSMAIMSIIAFADEHFSKKLTAQQLASITTVRSLMELIGSEHFSD